MKIERLVLGILDTNCYIVSKNGYALIIDPADDASYIIEKCKNYKVVDILVTHHHFDHIGALKELEEYYSINHNTYNHDYFDYVVLDTKGHTTDSVSFYFKKEKVLFSGDFIFASSIGRYDFENSSYAEMKKSLDFISRFPDDIKVYPGHGNETYLGIEKNNFKYFI